MARQLLGAGGQDVLDGELEILLKPVFTGKAVLGLYYGTSEFTYRASRVATAYYEADGRLWLTETITPLGIHYLAFGEDNNSTGTVRALIEQTLAEGLPDAAANGLEPMAGDQDGDEGEFLCVAGPRVAGAVRVVAVRKSEMLALSAVAGKAPAPTGEPLATADEAMEYLLN